MEGKAKKNFSWGTL